MKDKNIVKELDSIMDSIEQTALTMKDCNHIGEFEFHSNVLSKDVARGRKLSANISGSGTGND